MEPLQNILKRFSSLQSRSNHPEDWLDHYFEHPLVKELVARHPEINRDILERAVSKIYQAVREEEACRACPGLDRCPNLIRGHRAHLTWTGVYIEAPLKACEKWEAYEQQKKRQKLIQSHFIPKQIFEADFETIEQDAGRADAIEAVLRFCLTVEPGRPGSKGIYLYGPFGVGKSYIMGAAAKELAKRDIHSLMVYTPDFFREMKDSIQDRSLQEKLNVLKQVPVLILDDIGAETLSPWTRDEVLSPILQHRMNENLPTLYTSNYDYDLLEEHLGYSEKGGIEQMKAKRIMERIRHYTEIYAVKGPNRR
ncbi:MAG: primosomal protein DnaI [Bacillaceae bacterium]|nr:primosomal protein DnaI [Bacillaceae bacterium]